MQDVHNNSEVQFKQGLTQL